MHVIRDLLPPRAALWLACAVLSMPALESHATEADLKDQIYAYWARALYAPPRIDSLADLERERVPGSPEQLALARQQLAKQFDNSQWSDDARRLRLYDGKLEFSGVPTLRSVSDGGLGWRQLGLVGDPVAPAWAVDYVTEEIRNMSVKGRARKAEPLTASRGRQEAHWGALRDQHSGKVIKAADGLAFAGPVDKEGAASSRQTSAGTVVRIPLSASLAELDDWITSRALGLSLSLRRNGSILLSERLVVEGRLAVPAWVVNPDGLHAATLSGFSAGGSSCQDSNWLELKLAGNHAPEIWAVLLLAHPDMARSAVVKRVPGVQADAGDGEALREELEVRWNDNRFQPLRILARRYDITFAEHVAEPDGKYVQVWSEFIGSAWKVEVRARPDGAAYVANRYLPGYVAPLSVTGTPKCVPR